MFQNYKNFAFVVYNMMNNSSIFGDGHAYIFTDMLLIILISTLGKL